jgi:hypothetical protein
MPLSLFCFPCRYPLTLFSPILRQVWRSHNALSLYNYFITGGYDILLNNLTWANSL